MNESIFVQVSGIKGDARDANHKDWIAIHHMGFSVERSVDMNDLNSNQRTHANTEFGQIEVISSLGRASNDLMSAVANGKMFPEIKLHVCHSSEHSGNALEAYSIWTFRNALIDRYQLMIDSGGIPEEAWAIAYAHIEHEYKYVDRNSGKLVKEGEFNWDLRTGKAGA